MLITSTVHAARDKEIIQSARCVGYFRHFETRLKIPQDTLYSISLQETGKIHSNKKIKIAWPWTVNVEGRGYYFDSKREAMVFVRDQMRSGKESIDVGCMQVNLKYHPDAFRSLEHAFDPRTNIAYGAKFLMSKYEQLGSWSKAIAHYHSATPHLGEKYRDDVVKIAQNIDHYKSAFKRQPGSNIVNLSPFGHVGNVRQNKVGQKQQVDKSQEAQNTVQRPNEVKYAGAVRAKRPFINKDRKYRSNMMLYVNKKGA